MHVSPWRNWTTSTTTCVFVVSSDSGTAIRKFQVTFHPFFSYPSFLLYVLLSPDKVLHAGCHGQECDPNGVSCINCSEYQRCNGGAPTGPIFSCKKGAECGDRSLLEHCWTKLNCYVLNECTEVGIFPDVMVESNYFVCLPDAASGLVKYDFTCPEKEFFDQTARMCVSKDVTLETTLSSASENTPTVSTLTPTAPSPTIPSPTTSSPATPSPTTSSPATPSPTTSSPATPSPTTSSPTTPSPTTPSPTTPSPTTPSPTTPSPTTPSPTTPSPTTSSPTTPPSFVCTSSGIFVNPDNCKMYFRCSTSLKVYHYICPGASYFNENILKCSLIITPACQEQIVRNTTTSTTVLTTVFITTRTPVPTSPLTTSTTTPFPTTPTKTITPTSALLTTTTPPPSSTPPSTTTTQAPSTPFSCSSEGAFENPVDCKTYYRCSSTGKTFLYVCPGGSFYNELTKRCGMTITPRCRSKLKN